MNSEILKIRKANNESEVFDYKPRQIPEQEMLELIRQINVNFSELYGLEYVDEDIEKCADIFSKNIIILLNMFNKMGIYPDFFYDALIKAKINQKEENNKVDNLRKLYHLNSKFDFEKSVRDALEKQYFRVLTYPKRDINDALRGMLRLFKTYNIPYNINTKEECKKVCRDELWYNHISIMDKLLNSDDIYEDVDFMTKLLFEYISFFVAMGINPKEYIEKNIIKEEEHTKK